MIKKIKYFKKRIDQYLFWGSLRRLTPVSRVFGYDRGTPIDRYYIDQFLSKHATDIGGKVLEVGDSYYSHKYGAEKTSRIEVLHATNDNPRATIVGDLSSGIGIPTDMFNCIILTQTLQFIFDFKSALHTCYKALQPGGVLLITVPGISQISKYDMERWGEYWRFTSLSVKNIFEDIFETHDVQVSVYGNVLSSVAFLYGISYEELSKSELDFCDSDYELLIGVRVSKR